MAVSDDKIDRTVKKVLVIIFISSLIFTAAVIAGGALSPRSKANEKAGRSGSETESSTLSCPSCSGADALCARLALQRLYATAWNRMLESDPLAATTFGLNTYNDRLTNMSVEAIRSRAELMQELLDCALTYSDFEYGLPESDKLNYDLFVWMLKSEISYYGTGWYWTPTDQLFRGPQFELPYAFSAMPFREPRDFRNYISRLQQVPVYIDQTIDLMRGGLARGISVPKIAVAAVGHEIASIYNVSTVEESILYRPFKKLQAIAGSNPATQEIITTGKRVLSDVVLPSYRAFHIYWMNDYYPYLRETTGLSDLPNGLADYQTLIAYHTTTNLTYEEVHRLGLNEVKRIRGEMEEVIQNVEVNGSKFNGSLADFISLLRTSSQFYFTTEEDLLAHVRSIVKRAESALPQLFGKIPRCPVGVAPIPAEAAPAAPGAYYEDPDIDCTRPGMYYKNTYDLSSRPSYAMQSTSLHEAVPGHHFQIALSKELKGVPPFRRMVHPTAFIEGWALYAESLGKTMGFYESKFDYFGRLNDEIFRACRLVVDSGLHALNWTRQEAIDYMTENSALGKTDIEAEIDRYIVMPGQALSYKVGELTIQKLKKKYATLLGDRFDIRNFHDIVLGNGAVTMELLERIVDAKMASYFSSTNERSLSPADISVTLPSWSLSEGGISKIFEFRNFARATTWLQQVVASAEELDHHPEISVLEGTVTIHVSTKSCSCVTDKDVFLARRLDRHYSEMVLGSN